MTNRELDEHFAKHMRDAYGSAIDEAFQAGADAMRDAAMDAALAWDKHNVAQDEDGTALTPGDSIRDDIADLTVER